MEKLLDEFIQMAADITNLTATYNGEELAPGYVEEALDRHESSMPKQVLWVYRTCSCACCKDAQCPNLIVNSWVLNDDAQCTSQACSSRYYQCPDAGSHSVDHVNIALYTEGEPPSAGV